MNESRIRGIQEDYKRRLLEDSL